jgi:hypothetical protein
MADIQFDEPQYGQPSGAPSKRSFLTNLVINWGLAKDDASAQRTLLIILVVVIIAIVLVWTT